MEHPWSGGSPFFFHAEDGIRADLVTGVQTCALPISARATAKSSRQGATLAAVRQRASVRSAFPAAAPEEAACAKLDPAKLRTEIPAARTAASMPARPYIRDGRDSRRGPEGTAASSPRFAK